LLGERIEELEARLQAADQPLDPGTQRRLARLRGVLTWRLETDYHARLTDTFRHLDELNVVVDTMQADYDAFVRTRQAALHSYVGYEIPIQRLRARVAEGLARLNLLMARQGHMLETVAINELRSRRERLETYQNEARYAFADSYDRASRAQAQAADTAEDGEQG